MALTALSKKRLSDCDPRLIRLVEAIEGRLHVNVSYGYRGEKDQNEAFALGKSKLRFPQSKHNKRPSLAVDIYPIVDNEVAWGMFDELGRIAKEEAKRLGIPIVWGGDWKSLVDKPHFEL